MNAKERLLRAIEINPDSWPWGSPPTPEQIEEMNEEQASDFAQWIIECSVCRTPLFVYLFVFEEIPPCRCRRCGSHLQIPQNVLVQFLDEAPSEIREHLLAEALSHYTDPQHPEFDAVFNKQLRELRPDWFVTK